MQRRRQLRQSRTPSHGSSEGEGKTPKKEESNPAKIIGEVKIGNCNYKVVVKGDLKGEHEVELVGTTCDTRADAVKSTEVIDSIFNAKRVIYTPPMKFEKEEKKEVKTPNV